MVERERERVEGGGRKQGMEEEEEGGEGGRTEKQNEKWGRSEVEE